MSFFRKALGKRQPATRAHPEWLIVGLGNPGGQYAKTKHNVGFMCTNRLAHRMGLRFRGSSWRADLASGLLRGIPVALAQPQTYMNESGQAVVRLTRHFRLKPDRVLLIYDEVDLPFGTIRIRPSGSAAGHRGMQSVIREMGTDEIARIRVGIGRGAGETRDHVLAEFLPDQGALLPQLCDHVADAVETTVVDGLTTAMNRFNGPIPAVGAPA